MRFQVAKGALAAFGIGIALWVMGQALALPWPPAATYSLGGLFLLAGITRVLGDAGIKAQRMLRYGVAGVALTAAAWFAAGARLVDEPMLLVLGAAHIGVAWLAAVPEPESDDERESGRLILPLTISVSSLLGLAALGVTQDLMGGAELPYFFAGGMVAGGYLIYRGLMAGLALSSVAGVFALVVSARVLAGFTSQSSESFLARSTPVVAATCALGAIPLVIAFARRLPQVWKVLAPNLSPVARTILVWLTLPAVAALAVGLFARSL